MSVMEEYEAFMKREPAPTKVDLGAFFIEQMKTIGVKRKEIIVMISVVRKIKLKSAKLYVTRAISAARRAGYKFDGKPFKAAKSIKSGMNVEAKSMKIDIVEENTSLEKTNVVEEGDSADQLTPDELADKIRYYVAQVRDNIINIGKCLIQVKSQIDHGKWYDWINKNTTFSPQTAHKFIQCAERFANLAPARDLNSTQMLELLALPPPQVEDFFKKQDTAGTPVKDMTKLKLREEIKAWKKSFTDETNETTTKAVKSVAMFKTVRLKVLSDDEAELARLLQVALRSENKLSTDSVSSLQKWIETLSTPEND